MLLSCIGCLLWQPKYLGARLKVSPFGQMSNKHASFFNYDVNYKSEKIFSMGTVMELILASNYDVSYQQKKL